MGASTITIEVPQDVAEAYEKATPATRRVVEFQLQAKARDALKLPRRSLEEIMDDMSREAQERGLTPDILQAILDER